MHCYFDEITELLFRQSKPNFMQLLTGTPSNKETKKVSNTVLPSHLETGSGIWQRWTTEGFTVFL